MPATNDRMTKGNCYFIFYCISGSLSKNVNIAVKFENMGRNIEGARQDDLSRAHNLPRPAEFMVLQR